MLNSKYTRWVNELLDRFDRPIEQGSFIPPELIERVVGLKRDHADYSLEIIELRTCMEHLLEKTIGRRFMTRMSEKGIRFLTTSEAAKHGQQSFIQAQSRMEIWHYRTQLCVDPYLDELSGEEKKQYQEQQNVNARILLHMKEAEISDQSESIRSDSSRYETTRL